jgi:SNF2 family DNA or RNA helicase
MSFERWRDEYCQMIPGTTRVVRSKNEAKLVSLLRPHVLRRNSRDVLPDLPPLRFSHVPVHPSSLPPMTDEVAETAAVARAAVETMATPGGHAQGKIVLDGLDDIHMASLRRWTGIAKAPAIVEYLKMDLDSGMGKFVVFAWHREVIQMLRDGLAGTEAIHGDVSTTKRQKILDDFQAPGGKIRGLICQGEIASTAIPLTAADNAIFAEPPWVPASVEQAIKRLHRQGQTRPVHGRMFSLSGSFDEVVIGVLTRKVIETMRLNRSLETSPTQGQ